MVMSGRFEEKKSSPSSQFEEGRFLTVVGESEKGKEDSLLSLAPDWASPFFFGGGG